MQIRKVTYQDAKRLSYLIQKNADFVKENNYTTDQLSAWKKDNTLKAVKNKLSNREIFAVFEHQKLVGTIGLEGNNLVGLYISYTRRGEGLGRKLLAYIENYALENNINELHLTATPNGYGFYLKYGYIPYGNIDLYYDKIMFTETKMKKKL